MHRRCAPCAELGRLRTERARFDDPNHQAYSIHSYGAQFAEVGVVLNPKTGRSQLIGAMIWGASHALLEEAVIDRRSGAFVNRDLAGYLVPIHADIPQIDAVILDGYDEKANAFGVKGVRDRCLRIGRGGRERSVQRHRRASA